MIVLGFAILPIAWLGTIPGALVPPFSDVGVVGGDSYEDTRVYVQINPLMGDINYGTSI